MANRKTPFAFGEYYHIYNRGTNKGKIFKDKKDYIRFIKSLFVLNSTSGVKFSDISPGLTWTFDQRKTLVDIGAYCLMPNHFHILIKVKTNIGTSIFMQKLLTSYSMYFNIKNERSGRLFEGTFKSEHINNDSYLKYLFVYIHLNPVKLIDTKWKEQGIQNLNKTIKFLENYEYSSYKDYIKNNRIENKILNKDAFPKYFKNPTEHFDELIDWLNYKNG